MDELNPTTELEQGMDELNLNHHTNVELDIYDDSRYHVTSTKTLRHVTQDLIDYLRDAKAPIRKRSLAHIFDTFQKKYTRLVICDAITSLIDDNKLFCHRSGGVVGEKFQNNYNLRCNLNDWIVFNPYPHQTRKRDRIEDTRSQSLTESCNGEDEYPCIDNQIYHSEPQGKWSKGSKRKITESED